MTHILAIRTESFVPREDLLAALADHSVEFISDDADFDPAFMPEVIISPANPACVAILETILPSAQSVKWLHTFSAGIDKMTVPAIVSRSDLLITNNRGAFDVSIAEHVLGCIFAAAKRLPECFDAQRHSLWQLHPQSEVRGATLVIVGLGSIGTEVAKVASAVGMRVLGIRRGPQRTPPPNTVELVAGPERVGELASEADYLVLTTPLTSETRGLISSMVISRMKPSAWIINVSRGEVVDEDSLMDACKTHRIGGAALDVWWEEPLPSNSPWWKVPNVIVTPHASWSSQRDLRQRSVQTLLDNLARYNRGQPLANVVDMKLGY